MKNLMAILIILEFLKPMAASAVEANAKTLNFLCQGDGATVWASEILRNGKMGLTTNVKGSDKVIYHDVEVRTIRTVYGLDRAQLTFDGRTYRVVCLDMTEWFGYLQPGK